MQTARTKLNSLLDFKKCGFKILSSECAIGLAVKQANTTLALRNLLSSACFLEQATPSLSTNQESYLSFSSAFAVSQQK